MFKLKKITYPNEAAGWVDGVYYERKKTEESVDESTYLKNDCYLLPTKSWTETEPTGFGIYTYIETVAFAVDTGLKDVCFNIVILNDSDEEKVVSVKANDILKLDKVVLSPKSQTDLTFNLCSIEEISTICIYVPNDITEKSLAKDETIVVKSLDYKELEKKEKGSLPSIFLASDSTVQSYKEELMPQAGWGQVMPLFTKNLSVINKGIGARSSKSFIIEGRLDEILSQARPGDYLLMQWGHNDATAIRPNRYCTPLEYKAWLTKYVNACIARDITPVIVTPVSMRAWDEASSSFPISFKEYRDKCIELSDEMNVVLVDLGKKSNDLLNSLPKTESRYLYLQAPKGAYPNSNYKDGVNDRAHLSYYGALTFCKIIVEELMEKTPLRELLHTDVLIEKPDFIFPEPPANIEAPGNFTIQEIQYSGISANFLLSWDAVPDADGYLVMRKGSKEFQFSQLRRVSAQEHASSTVLPFTLLAEDSYDLYVVACIADGLSKPSSYIHADLHSHLS